jgi:hypothetical protein
MTCDETLAQRLALLHHQGHVAYRALDARFQLDDDCLNSLPNSTLLARSAATGRRY